MDYFFILTLAFAPPGGGQSVNTYAQVVNLKPGTTRSEAFHTIRQGVSHTYGLPPNTQVMFFSLEPQQLSAAEDI